MLSKTLEKRSLADSHRALGIDPLYWKQSEPTAVTNLFENQGFYMTTINPDSIMAEGG